jgi:hypothetical protein
MLVAALFRHFVSHCGLESLPFVGLHALHGARTMFPRRMPRVAGFFSCNDLLH